MQQNEWSCIVTSGLYLTVAPVLLSTPQPARTSLQIQTYNTRFVSRISIRVCTAHNDYACASLASSLHFGHSMMVHFPRMQTLRALASRLAHSPALTNYYMINVLLYLIAKRDPVVPITPSKGLTFMLTFAICQSPLSGIRDTLLLHSMHQMQRPSRKLLLVSPLSARCKRDV